AYPLDCLVGHVLSEVIALLGGLVGFEGGRALIDGGELLIGLSTKEAEEILKAPAAGRPLIERYHGARFPHRDLMTFAELGRRVAVELERHREWRFILWQYRRVARGRGRDFTDTGHIHGVVIAPGEERLARRRSQGCGMEAVELHPTLRQALGRRCVDGPTEGAGSGETHLV